MQSVHLLPIEADETKNATFWANPECVPILKVYPDYYKKIGFHKPWIGYFASIDDNELVGAGGYKGAPREGKIEIAYGTFKNYEGQGIGTAICRQLVLLALQTNANVRITARTLQDGLASMAILKKNGFTCLGIVSDEDDGDVYEWELLPNSR